MSFKLKSLLTRRDLVLSRKWNRFTMTDTTGAMGLTILIRKLMANARGFGEKQGRRRVHISYYVGAPHRVTVFHVRIPSLAFSRSLSVGERLQHFSREI